MLNEVQSFWAGLRMAVMNRQPGLSWQDTGQMLITDFFHVLKLSERQSSESDASGLSKAALSRAARRPTP